MHQKLLTFLMKEPGIAPLSLLLPPLGPSLQDAEMTKQQTKNAEQEMMERAWTCDELIEPYTNPGLPFSFMGTIYYCTLYVTLNKEVFLLF